MRHREHAAVWVTAFAWTTGNERAIFARFQKSGVFARGISLSRSTKVLRGFAAQTLSTIVPKARR